MNLIKIKVKRQRVKEWPQFDSDLSSEHEKILVRYFGIVQVLGYDCEKAKLEVPFSDDEVKTIIDSEKEVGAFVFVTHWPLKIKSFYMKQCVDVDSSGECESFDLLAPRVGEMFGGSMREWRYKNLTDEMNKRGMKKEDGTYGPLQWYTDLRLEGSSPHGGWGMGFDRLLTMMTGAPSVRDTVPLPVYYRHCPY